jgi:transcriptional regulator with XRE-family HTH domain
MQTIGDLELGRVMRRIRFELGHIRGEEVSQKEFGALVGQLTQEKAFDQSTVSGWERGATPPSGKTVVAALGLLSEAVGRPVNYEELLRGIKVSWASYRKAAA